jgi:hypothetical protein
LTATNLATPQIFRPRDLLSALLQNPITCTGCCPRATTGTRRAAKSCDELAPPHTSLPKGCPGYHIPPLGLTPFRDTVLPSPYPLAERDSLLRQHRSAAALAKRLASHTGQSPMRLAQSPLSTPWRPNSGHTDRSALCQCRTFNGSLPSATKSAPRRGTANQFLLPMPFEQSACATNSCRPTTEIHCTKTSIIARRGWLRA